MEAIYEDILSFIICCFAKLKTDNQFVCPNNAEKKLIKIYERDISYFTNNLIKMFEVVQEIQEDKILPDPCSKFVDKLKFLIQSKKITNENSNLEILNNHIYKFGMKK